VISVVKEHVNSPLLNAVEEGHILTVRISDTSFKNVLVSILLVPDIGSYNVINYLHDNIESVADEGVRNTVVEAIASRAEIGLSKPA